jgi:preprotein translocase subunit SecE
MEKLKSFFYGVKKEIERVRWPNRKNMVKYSTAVLTLCVFLGVFFYVVNMIVVLLKEVWK